MSSPTSAAAHCNSQQLHDYFHCLVLEYGIPLCNYMVVVVVVVLFICLFLLLGKFWMFSRSCK